MKRLIALLVLLTVSASTLSGCHGSFVLGKSLGKWNASFSNKYARSGVLWVLVLSTVQTLAFIGDVAIFNLVEFWSGSNPLASAEKDFYFVNGSETYKVHACKEGKMVDYTIKHYNDSGLVATTLINWDTISGKSVVTTDENGFKRDYIVSRDGNKIRIDRYTDSKLDEVSWYTPKNSGEMNQFASAR